MSVQPSVYSCPLMSLRPVFPFSATCVRERMDNERFSTLTLEFASLPIQVAAWMGGAAPAGLIKGNAYSTTSRSPISFPLGPQRHHLLSGGRFAKSRNPEFPTCPSATLEPAACHCSAHARMPPCCKNHECVENLPPKRTRSGREGRVAAPCLLRRAGLHGTAGIAGRGLSFEGFLLAASKL
ncbi:hypothetical protein HJG60_009654 [Phyllostomus discolor]|uniref:Uncharacterized protein n=1 Tax=Phyllostomus discolor TaxID=89673 RepID=A0A834EQ88_9CHIR|nr:hypothetical protein HJG60_009654 [Phyllostomus discolor]